MAQFKHKREDDVITAFGPVADYYAARRDEWEQVAPDQESPKAPSPAQTTAPATTAPATTAPAPAPASKTYTQKA